MKAVKATLAGEDYYFLFNGAAMFAIEDEFGGASKLFDTIQKNSREAFDAMCRAAVILGEQGELARRSYGYDHGAMPTVERMEVEMTPADIITLRSKIVNAVVLGFGRDVKEEGDVDLGLVELQQKKTKS